MKTEIEVKEKIKELELSIKKNWDNKGKIGNKGYQIPYIRIEVETLKWVLKNEDLILIKGKDETTDVNTYVVELRYCSTCDRPRRHKKMSDNLVCMVCMNANYAVKHWLNEEGEGER